MRKWVQAEKFNRIKGGEFIVQCDYSESYKKIEQDEIKVHTLDIYVLVLLLHVAILMSMRTLSSVLLQ